VSAYQRTFNRYEFKYVMPIDLATAFVDEVRGHLEPDPHAGADGLYRISSTYYDSASLDCYWEKIEGQRVRRKLRIRRYMDDPSDSALIEIKQRVDRTVQKRREPMRIEEIFSILPGPDDLHGICDGGPEVAGVLGEAMYLVQAYRMRPKVMISYHRRPFQGIQDDGLRLTIDSKLSCRSHNLDWAAPEDNQDVLFMPPELSVVEVKFNERVPLWLTRHVSRFECEMRRLSKYTAGVDRLWHVAG
jgi:SPX domain protein involved in polyphosphate accumulation